MSKLSHLKPQALWQHFEQIALIPHESGSEAALRAYVASQAERLGLKHATDAAGNLIVYKPGRGEPLIIQAHLDMVCEKNQGHPHDFANDPLELVVDGEFVRAQGTTLGADNGLGVAAMLALMETPDTPSLELLFTVDEETGLSGAVGLDVSLLKGRCLLNLDSEADGVITLGCAGGLDTEIEVPLERETARGTALTLFVSGLTGGHSGTDIHLGRGNAIKIVARLLNGYAGEWRLIGFTGGSKRNAIAREAEAVVLVADQPAFAQHVAEQLELLKDEYRERDAGLTISCTPAAAATEPLTSSASRRLINLIQALPHGVTRATTLLGQPVTATSTNLAIVATGLDSASVITNQRSFSTSEKRDLSATVRAIAELAGAVVVNGQQYPGWQPDLDSPLLTTAQAAYRALSGREAQLEVIHAGLEAGVIKDHLPELDTIAIGPEIIDAHSPFERTPIASVAKFWDFLLEILKRY